MRALHRRRARRPRYHDRSLRALRHQPQLGLQVGRAGGHGGRAALADRSRAPRRCPHRIPEATAELLCDARRKHPQWGPKKVLDLLRPRHRRIPTWPAIMVSRSSTSGGCDSAFNTNASCPHIRSRTAPTSACTRCSRRVPFDRHAPRSRPSNAPSMCFGASTTRCDRMTPSVATPRRRSIAHHHASTRGACPRSTGRSTSATP